MADEGLHAQERNNHGKRTQDLDEAILPGLIDGEERIPKSYDDAMKHQPIAPETRCLLAEQRAEVEEKIRSMQRLSETA